MTKQLPASPQATDEEIVGRIYLVRGEKIMLDRDLAELYGVEVRTLNQAVKRNLSRFPDDFMFQLSEAEWDFLRSQIVILEKGRGKYSKFLPFAFTEQGVAQLSSVLRSEQAIQVNIHVVRVYTKMRRLLIDAKDLWQRIESMERRLDKGDEKTDAILAALKRFLTQEEKPRTQIGFKLPSKKKKK